MMDITRRDLRNLCRRRIGDMGSPADFTDMQINQWVNDAIADYSNFFARRATEDITTLLNDRQYDLNARFINAVSVEYPQGDDPPSYLVRKDYRSAGFWDADGYYDIVKRDDEGNPSEIWISEKPAAGETIRVEYTTDHDSLDSDDDFCAIPERHIELIALFVIWCAWQELAVSEGTDPRSVNSLLVGQLQVNSYRAERSYRSAVKQMLETASESGVLVWKMDKWDL